MNHFESSQIVNSDRVVSNASCTAGIFVRSVCDLRLVETLVGI